MNVVCDVRVMPLVSDRLLCYLEASELHTFPIAVVFSLKGAQFAVGDELNPTSAWTSALLVVNII